MQINTKSLLRELQWAQRFIETKSTIPILSNVLFEADGSRLSLTATDLELSGTTSVEGVGKEKWSTTAPVKGLIKYLQKVDEPEVTLSTSEDHWLKVVHGPGVSRIAGMSKESYPELPAFPAPQCTLRGLPLAIQRIIFAISSEETRFTLNGALLEIDEDEGRLISTDGHRLSLAPVGVKGMAKIHTIVHKPALLEAARLDGDCAYGENEEFSFLSWGQHKIVTRKLAGNFPDYPLVMGDGDWPNHVNIPVKTTLRTLERVAVYADERSHAVQFEIRDGSLKIFTSTFENGEAEGIVPTQGGEIVKPLLAGYNADYIGEFLHQTENQFVAFCWRDEKSLAEFTTGDGWEYALMPMRI